MKWLHFILSHSLFIAFCAVAMAFQTILLLHGQADIFLYGFIFFATMCSYNFYWLLSKYSLAGNFSITFFLKKEFMEIILLVFSAAGLLFCFLSSALQVANVWPAVLFTVLYALPLLPFRFLRFTRKAGVLKTTLLAFTWTYVTAFIPMQKALLLLNNAELFIITRHFLFMLMLCIIFDCRDIALDKIRGLHSLATDLKPKILRYLIIIIFIILFATNFLFHYFGVPIAQTIALQVSTIVLLIAYYYSTKKQGYLFYYFFIDGLMLFSALATYIASI